jgi:carboxyl-terminal processing protease
MTTLAVSLRTLLPSLLALLLAAPLAFAQEPPPTTLDPQEAPPEQAVPAEPSGAESAAAEEQRVSLDEVRRFVSVFRAVQQAYVDTVEDQRLMSAAIRGLLNDLDPHSAYLDAEATQSMNETATGAYGGLGLEVLQRPDRSLMVIAPMDDTPAAKAGIRSGDVITELDGVPISADSVDAAVEAMRGEPGTVIVLTVVREGEPEPLRISLTREIIQVASARGESLGKDFGYVRIAVFQADTGSEVRRRIETLIEANGGPLKGLVLDLRSNPGGLLNAGIEVADLFLDEGLIVSTRGRLANARAEYSAKRGDVLAGAPIALLIDSGSASAAEVVAGALRDHRRAVILGSTSFGKGSVQTVLPLDNGDSIKLTTARYYTPNGTSIQATGIVPDIEIPENAELSYREGTLAPSLREADLPGHLEAESADAGSEDVAALDDYAVNEALNLLRGLAVFGRRG